MPFFRLLAALAVCLALPAHALTFEPAAPVVAVGETLSLSVTDSIEPLFWTDPVKGRLQGDGTQVTYHAPLDAGVDAVLALDGSGRAVTLLITVQEQKPVPDFSPENAVFEVYTNRSEILSLALSADGATLWVGTNGGLEQRDAASGRLLRVHTTLDGLPHNQIESLALDVAGRLWVASSAGLAYLDTTGEWIIDDTLWLEGYPYRLAADNEGGLWLGYHTGKLEYRDAEEEVTVYDSTNSVQDDFISSLIIDGAGGVWLGFKGDETSDRGVAHLNAAGEWTLYNTANSGLPDNRVFCLETDGAGGLWVGTIGFGLAHLDAAGNWMVYTTANSGLPNNAVTSLDPDGAGGLWVGAGIDLARLDAAGDWSMHSTTDLPGDYIETFVADDKGGLWAGMRNSGLLKIDAAGNWTTYDTGDLPHKLVTDLDPDGSGGLWVSTFDGGLVHHDATGKWTRYNADNSDLLDDTVRNSILDATGGLWVGTIFGLSYLDVAGNWTLYDSANSGWPGGAISGLVLDGKGGLWAGISPDTDIEGGLVHRDVAGNWRVYDTIGSGLLDNRIEHIISDGADGLWMDDASDWEPVSQTYLGSGLAHRDAAGNWTQYNTLNSGLPDNNIQALLLDGTGGLWVGTLNGGLAHRDVVGTWAVYRADIWGYNEQGEWTLITPKNSGLPHNSVSQLVSDGVGGLWIATSGGLAHLDAVGEWTSYNFANSGLPASHIDNLGTDGEGGLWIGMGRLGLVHLSFTPKTALVQQIDDAAERERLLNGTRAAILVHPLGAGTPGDSQSRAIENMSNYAYQTLHSRGYDNDEIYYLSYKPDVDINADGFIDINAVDAPVKYSDWRNGAAPVHNLTEDDIDKAFVWAASKGKLDQPLLVIFIDHGDAGQLRLAPDVALSAEELGALLEDYRAATGNQVVTILEACHTGTLLPDLSGEQRIAVTSADDRQAYYDNLGMLSFTRLFFERLRRGDSYDQAFDDVSAILPHYGFPFVEQQPQLDDNGDRLFDEKDGEEAKKFCLNGCFKGLAGDVTLEPTLRAEGGALHIQVRAGITQGRIQRVWAVVGTPESQARDANGFALVQPPTVTLTYDSGLWQGRFDAITTPGDYSVSLVAEDQDDFTTAAPPVRFKFNSDGTLAIGAVPQMPGALGAEFEGNAPIPSQAVYRDGDVLKVNLPLKPEDRDQYVGLAFPDGTIVTLDIRNRFSPFDDSHLQRWQGGDTAIYLPLPEWLPRGRYQLYLLRVPADVEPLTNLEAWEFGVSGFNVE